MYSAALRISFLSVALVGFAWLAPDVLARYKHEVEGTLDFRGTRVHPRECE